MTDQDFSDLATCVCGHDLGEHKQSFDMGDDFPPEPCTRCNCQDFVPVGITGLDV